VCYPPQYGFDTNGPTEVRIGYEMLIWHNFDWLEALYIIQHLAKHQICDIVK
jgi:hypothetical protein